MQNSAPDSGYTFDKFFADLGKTLATAAKKVVDGGSEWLNREIYGWNDKEYSGEFVNVDSYHLDRAGHFQPGPPPNPEVTTAQGTGHKGFVFDNIALLWGAAAVIGLVLLVRR